MNEVVVELCSSVDTFVTSAQWYNAMTLTERISLLQDHYTEKPVVNLADHERARQRYQTWKRLIPFKQETIFAQKLAQVGLTEDDLLTVLAEPAEAWQARHSTPPSWLSSLIEAFAEDHTLPDSVLPVTHPVSATLLQPFTPLLKQGLARLTTSIATLVQTTPVAPFDPQTIAPLLFTGLAECCALQVVRTVILELHVAREQGHLQGKTSEERFSHFVQQLARPEGISSFLQEYSVLARQLVETVERWLTCQMELLTRLCADWEEIRTTFLSGDDPGVVVKVQSGLGDPHRGGRTVTVLTWSSGFRLVYKPRSMATDVHFQALLARINEWGYQPAFRTTTILNKESHGWVEFIEKASCSSEEQIARFYLRQGGYLALLYALESSDFHAENLIAAGEHPMLIDLETLLQPSITVQEAIQQPSVQAEEAIQQKYTGMNIIGQSVLRVGLLPQRFWSNSKSVGIDLSGLGGHAGQLTPTPVPQLQEIGTDQMRIGRERVEVSLGDNRPQLHNQDVEVKVYAEHVVQGFTLVYQLLIQHRDELINELLPWFAQDTIRCLPRQSELYNKLIKDSFHPNVLRDALDRDQIFDGLWITVGLLPRMARLIPAEQADLQHGDIPLFTTTPSSRDIFTAHGECIQDFFEVPGLESVKRRLLSLDEQDLHKQVWIIRASFHCMMLDADRRLASIPEFKPSQKEMSNERLLAMASTIGERIQALALHTDTIVGWLIISAVNQHEWRLEPAQADLYDGITGIALFFGYLGNVTGNEHYTTLARMTLNTARYQIMSQKKRSVSASIGAFDGIAGYIYTLSHLGTLWQDASLYREAEQLVESLRDRIAKDQQYDVTGGAAGYIACLLSLYSVAPSQTVLEAALRCGDHLVVSAMTMPTGLGWHIWDEDVPLTGMAHGNAGIALNLLRLFELSGKEQFRETALEAMAYERSLFSVEQHNWPDLRKERDASKAQATRQESPSYMVAWCHGAAGIGLARLGALHIHDDEITRSEIASALHTVLTSGFGLNHIICHGDMGNLDTLLTATQLINDTSAKQGLKHIIPLLLDSIDEYGWLSGVAQGIEVPGLMVGLAGTGYMLLRLLAPDRVPSVLLLEPPVH